MYNKSTFIFYIIIILCFVFVQATSSNHGKNKRSPNDTSNPVDFCSHSSCNCTNFLPNITAQWLKVICKFGKDEVVDVLPGSLPKKAREIELSAGRHLRFSQESFTNVDNPFVVTISGFNVAVIAREAFLNSLAVHPTIHIKDCELVTIENGAFKNTNGSQSVNITQCNHVIVEGEAFFRLTLMSISQVLRLELKEGAFILRQPRNPKKRHGYITKIILNNVNVESFPKKTFGSSLDEVRLEQVNVRDVHGDAFSATSYNTVIAINSTFYKIYKEAFSHRTNINHKIELYNCTIASLASDSIMSAASNFIIRLSKLKEVASGAIKMFVAKVIIEETTFGVIHSKGFELSTWNQINIQNNVFDLLESEAIVCHLADDSGGSGVSYSFSFVENGIINLTQGSLKFISDIHAVLPNIVYEKTYFNQDCRCDIEVWLKNALGKNSSFLQEMMNNSFCTPDPILKSCFNLFQESMLIHNYTTELCTNGTNKIQCLPSITKTINNDLLNSKFLDRKKQLREAEEAEMLNKKILRIALIVPLVGIIIIVLFVTIKWRRRCVGNANVSSNNCCVRVIDRLFNGNYGSDAARSISRLSIHEYNESHRLNETRILDIENDGTEDEQLIEVDIPMIDKATQTLPEELTKELLESLREKLDDPDNYSEAREMIEHLYDLIHVEEMCNNNKNIQNGPANTDYIDDMDNLYDVIQVPVRRKGKNNKIMVNIGTRVPSLEKLAQFSPYMRPTALCHEYFEPRDRALHLYAELPGDRNSELPSQMPDVLGERTSRPLSFLRAIGEKIQPSQSTSTAAVGSVRSTDSASRMANRPLPEKPKDPGEGTSFQRH